MSFIVPPDPATVDPKAATTLEAIRGKLGMVPNVFAILAKAPSALKAIVQIDQANASGHLAPAEREIVALAASQANGCQYCLSAHTVLGQGAGLTVEQTLHARAGGGSTVRAAAISAFTLALVEHRGNVPSAVLDGAKTAGLTEADLLEIVANVGAMTVTNYVNNLAGTEIDFPIAPMKLAA